MTGQQKPVFALIAKDHLRDRESWSFMAVIHFTGDLAMAEDMPSNVSEEQIAEIFAFLQSYNIHIQFAGCGGAGQPFSSDPWLQFYPNHIIITQHGGLDI